MNLHVILFLYFQEVLCVFKHDYLFMYFYMRWRAIICIDVQQVWRIIAWRSLSCRFTCLYICRKFCVYLCGAPFQASFWVPSDPNICPQHPDCDVVLGLLLDWYGCCSSSHLTWTSYRPHHNHHGFRYGWGWWLFMKLWMSMICLHILKFIYVMVYIEQYMYIE